jgi:putative ABC transport system permease protein
LQEQWANFRPDFPFTYKTVEDNFLQQYTAEEKLGKLIGYFAVIAIIIASLGLLGLASFTTEQRTREIGIRKVLGASVYEILVLLLKGFSKWVVIAFIIACPLAYFAMEKWLQNFAYHSDINIMPFIIGGLFSLLLAWFTVGFLSVKASLSNPIDVLKSE